MSDTNSSFGMNHLINEEIIKMIQDIKALPVQWRVVVAAHTLESLIWDLSKQDVDEGIGVLAIHRGRVKVAYIPLPAYGE